MKCIKETGSAEIDRSVYCPHISLVSVVVLWQMILIDFMTCSVDT